MRSFLHNVKLRHMDTARLDHFPFIDEIVGARIARPRAADGRPYKGSNCSRNGNLFGRWMVLLFGRMVV